MSGDARATLDHATAALVWRWRSLDRRASGGALTIAQIRAELDAIRPIAAATAALAVVAGAWRRPRLPAGREVRRG